MANKKPPIKIGDINLIVSIARKKLKLIDEIMNISLDTKTEYVDHLKMKYTLLFGTKLSSLIILESIHTFLLRVSAWPEHMNSQTLNNSMLSERDKALVGAFLERAKTIEDANDL